jgi:hypothetical protein
MLICDEGFAPSDAHPFTCGADGMWIDGSLTCKAKSCPTQAPTAHAQECPASTYDPSHTLECYVKCAAGYTNEGSGQGHYYCSVDEEWVPTSDGELVCKGVECPPDNPLPSALHHTSCLLGHHGEAPCILDCKPGYTATDRRNFTCGADGKWTGGNIACSPKKCPKGPPTNHTIPCPATNFDPLNPTRCSPNAQKGIKRPAAMASSSVISKDSGYRHPAVACSATQSPALEGIRCRQRLTTPTAQVHTTRTNAHWRAI